jgi:hypothetical protein
MRAHKIAGYRKRRRVRTSVPEPADQKEPDQLKRDVTADAVNLRHVGDITYLPIADGTNLYLASVIEGCSRRLAGWAIADHMRTSLVEDALNNAAATRGSLAGAIFHLRPRLGLHGQGLRQTVRPTQGEPAYGGCCKKPSAGSTRPPAAAKCSGGLVAATTLHAGIPGAGTRPNRPPKPPSPLRSRQRHETHPVSKDRGLGLPPFGGHPDGRDFPGRRGWHPWVRRGSRIPRSTAGRRRGW